jgi:hypothetical protein
VKLTMPGNLCLLVDTRPPLPDLILYHGLTAVDRLLL